MLRNEIVGALDRFGTRSLLAVIASGWARTKTGEAVSVLYDEMWIDRVHERYLPRSKNFEYYGYDLFRLKTWLEHRLAASFDYYADLYTPKDGDVILDVGAGIGVDALAFSPVVGHRGEIHALEAHPDTFRALEKTCELNNLRNVRCSNVAITDSCGTVRISDLSDSETNHIVEKSDGYEVNAIDLDHYFQANAIEQADLLKMNIEGAERLAILGMSECVRRVRHVVICCHDFLAEDGTPEWFVTRDLVTSFLVDSGFEIAQHRDDPRPWVRDQVRAWRRDCR